MKNVEKNLKYIKEEKAEDIEWTKLFGAYSCGRKIGEDIKSDNLLNLEILKNIRGEIETPINIMDFDSFYNDFSYKTS